MQTENMFNLFWLFERWISTLIHLILGFQYLFSLSSHKLEWHTKKLGQCVKTNFLRLKLQTF